MHPLLNTAIKAARRAGSIILRYADQLDRLDVETKGRNDFVTAVDRAAEDEILFHIKKAYPDHAILAEESGSQEGSDYRWIIDPLDGTTNFLHGYPQYAVSIAVTHKDQLDQAVVYDPLRDELFTASRGVGAQLNDRRIRVSQTKSIGKALLGTGFPFKAQEHLEVWIDCFRDLIQECSGIRRAGSAALDLAHVACGRLDGFWEIGLKPWDMAAGALLIQEAGGVISDFGGGHEYLTSGNIICANLQLHETLRTRITPYLGQKLKV